MKHSNWSDEIGLPKRKSQKKRQSRRKSRSAGRGWARVLRGRFFAVEQYSSCFFCSSQQMHEAFGVSICFLHLLVFPTSTQEKPKEKKEEPKVQEDEAGSQENSVHGGPTASQGSL